MLRSYAAITLRMKKLPVAVAVGIYAKDRKLPDAYADLDAALGGGITEAIGRDEFKGSLGEVKVFYPPQGTERLYLLGLGPPGGDLPEVARLAMVALTKAADDSGDESIAVRLPMPTCDPARLALETTRMGRAMGEGPIIANFAFTDFKRHGGGIGIAPDPHPPRSKLPALPTFFHVDPAVIDAMDHGLLVGESIELARTLAATPPNIANPAYIVDRAKKIAKETGLECRIIDAMEAATLNMGGLLAVGRAGTTPPALIQLAWRGKRKTGSLLTKKTTGRKTTAKTSSHTRPILLVGKAVTFDTGGYSIKPGESMTRMKYDKCGGMAVLATMHAIARLKLPVDVIALIPTAENMIATGAYRPDDILTLTNGVCVEVTNTDAEGRLILADALAYGCKQYDPSVVIDLATLTGGVVTALGTACAGLFSSENALAAQLTAAGHFTGERVWRLPLWQDYVPLLKSTHADITNSGGREAHPVQGAVFLAHFTGHAGKPRAGLPRDDSPPTMTPKRPADPAWAHLDIAGVADARESNALFPKGPTGWGVRLLVQWLETRIKADANV